MKNMPYIFGIFRPLRINRVCQHFCLGRFCFLGVTLDSAENPFAKTPFSWLPNLNPHQNPGCKQRVPQTQEERRGAAGRKKARPESGQGNFFQRVFLCASGWTSGGLCNVSGNFGGISGISKEFSGLSAAFFLGIQGGSSGRFGFGKSNRRSQAGA